MGIVVLLAIAIVSLVVGVFFGLIYESFMIGLANYVLTGVLLLAAFYSALNSNDDNENSDNTAE